jgi:hypothetical protein
MKAATDEEIFEVAVGESRTIQAPFDVAVTSQPEERERTDGTVRGHATAVSSYEVTMLLRPRAALGRRQGVRPTSH